MSQLYFGDNLHALRDHLAAESVDLIYLAPPFNSKRDYNLLFKSPKAGTERRAVPTNYSEAQITAFEDSWHRGEQAEREFDELVHAPKCGRCFYLRRKCQWVERVARRLRSAAQSD